MKSLNGSELASYIKEKQAHIVAGLRAQNIKPKLVIIRNNGSPVIEKYVSLKQRYGDDIGVIVEDRLCKDLAQTIVGANTEEGVHAIIVQLPLSGEQSVDGILDQIAPEKDVDGLGSKAKFDSATATAINWLLAGYNIDLAQEKIALVGHGRLIGTPLERMWRNSGYDVTVFDKGSDLNELINYNLIVSATGVPHLIKPEMVKTGAILIDAGTASENGMLVGDVDDAVRGRKDLAAITPKIGGVGPLTVAALFEHVLIAAQQK